MKRVYLGTDAAGVAGVAASMERAYRLLESTAKLQSALALSMAKLQAESARHAAILRAHPGLAALARQAEEQRVRGKIRAQAVGHPEWSNACGRCGAELKTTDDSRCAVCSILFPGVG